MYSTQIEKIPAPVITIISHIYDYRYSHDRINSLFLAASAPEEILGGNKYNKITDWLRLTNKKSPEPLKVLGTLLEDFLERDDIRGLHSPEEDSIEKLREEQKRIKDTLTQNGFVYSRGGFISTAGGAYSTKSLQESISKQGLIAIDYEIKRTLDTVESDPMAAVHYAGNILEVCIKDYLDQNKVSYKEGDTLSDLWSEFTQYLGINPKNFDAKGLKQISSGLFQIVHGTMYLRNKKSAAHGRSESQLKDIHIKPRHARLAIHSAHTIAAYVVELMEVTKTE